MPPIKILHLADIHIGLENYGRLDPASGLNSRIVDFLRRMSQAIDHALEQEVDICLFAGDAYKNQRPNPTIQREFARRIRKLTEADVPVVLLVGNHDMSTADRAASSIDIFDTLRVPSVFVANRERLFQITCRRGQLLQVATVPYPQRSRLLSHDEFRNMSIEELDQALVDIVEQNITALAEEAQQNPTCPTVFVGHFSVRDAIQGSEQSVMLGRDVIIAKSALANSVWDYVALGHIHKHQDLNLGSQPSIVYPGSLERIDFGEEKEIKGFVLVEVEKGKATWEFVPVRSRKFTTIQVDVRQSDDPMTQILDEIDTFNVQDAVVKVIIHVREEQDPLIEDRQIRQALRQASYVAGIQHQVDRAYRRRLGDVDIETLTPEQALNLYFEAKGVGIERKQTLMNHAERIMKMR